MGAGGEKHALTYPQSKTGTISIAEGLMHLINGVKFRTCLKNLIFTLILFSQREAHFCPSYSLGQNVRACPLLHLTCTVLQSSASSLRLISMPLYPTPYTSYLFFIYTFPLSIPFLLHSSLVTRHLSLVTRYYLPHFSLCALPPALCVIPLYFGKETAKL